MDWVAKYKQSHQNVWNQRLHAVGIPLIVIAVPLAPFFWKAALGLFVFGWILQFAGHACEGKPPAFFSDARFLIVGPVWWVRRLFGRKIPKVAGPPPRQ